MLSAIPECCWQDHRNFSSSSGELMTLQYRGLSALYRDLRMTLGSGNDDLLPFWKPYATILWIFSTNGQVQSTTCSLLAQGSSFCARGTPCALIITVLPSGTCVASLKISNPPSVSSERPFIMCKFPEHDKRSPSFPGLASSICGVHGVLNAEAEPR